MDQADRDLGPTPLQCLILFCVIPITFFGIYLLESASGPFASAQSCNLTSPVCSQDTTRNSLIHRFGALGTVTTATSTWWPYGTSVPTLTPHTFIGYSTDLLGWQTERFFSFLSYLYERVHTTLTGPAASSLRATSAWTVGFRSPGTPLYHGYKFGFRGGPQALHDEIAQQCRVYTWGGALLLTLDESTRFAEAFVWADTGSQITIYVKWAAGPVSSYTLPAHVALTHTFDGSHGNEQKELPMLISKLIYADYAVPETQAAEFFDLFDMNLEQPFSPVCYGRDCSALHMVCSGHGRCIAADTCDCCVGYSGPACGEWTCGAIPHDRADVCSFHGTCESPDNCSCPIDYYGSQCEQWDCFGFNRSDPSVCSGHGVCGGADVCFCEARWEGIACDVERINLTLVEECWGVQQIEPSACSGHGHCVGADNCTCFGGYTGADCSLSPACFPGCVHGECVEPSGGGLSCFCDGLDWIGTQCELPHRTVAHVEQEIARLRARIQEIAQQGRYVDWLHTHQAQGGWLWWWPTNLANTHYAEGCGWRDPVTQDCVPHWDGERLLWRCSYEDALCYDVLCVHVADEECVAL